MNNPLKYSDPSGEFVDTIWDVANIAYDIYNCDWGSLGVDTAAAFLPFVPAGITKIGKAAKIVDKAGDAGKVLNKTNDIPQVLKNKAKGDAFRDEIGDLLMKEGKEIKYEQYKQTPFGKRRIDIDVSDKGNPLGGIETKTGNSRYTPSQRAKDEWLKQNDYPVNIIRD